MNDHPLVYSTAWPAWNMCDADVGREPLQIASGTANYHDCEGLFTFKNCTLVPAVLDYDVTVKNNIVTYSPPTERSHVVAISGGYCQNSTVLAVMGFTSMMQPYITANGSLGRWYNLLGDSEEHPIETYNTQTFTSFSMSYLDITPGTDACTITTRDPYSDIVDAFNDLLFRSGVYLGKQANLPDLVDEPFPVRQTMRASLTRDQNVFHSDFHWFAAAAAVQILAVLLILPAYWGWWKIGVELTLSPFHTAKAFDAPFLKNVNSAAGSMGVVKEMGDARLQLGVVDVHDSVHGTGEEKLGLRLPQLLRVGLAESESVTLPVRGARFPV